MKRRLSFLLLIVAMLAAACSSGSSDTAVAANQPDAAGSDASDTDTAAPQQDDAEQRAAQDSDTQEPVGGAVEQGGTAMAAASPIGAFFADDGGFDAAIAEYTLQVEESILRCMAEQGFEFAVTGGAARANPIEERQNDLTEREWTTEFGFGISTSFDSIAQNQATNPNFAIFGALSPAEREIWALTLNGVGLEGLGGDGPVDFSLPLEEQGCIGQGIIETGGQEGIEGLGTFGDIIEQGEEALLERREMVEVITAWSRCMSEAGFPNFAGLDDPEDEIFEKLGVITAPIGAALQALSDEEGDALFSGESLDVDKLPGLDVDALRELQASEIELALVDLDCYDAEVRAVYEPLRNDLENGLLEEYSAEFNAVKNLGS